MATIPRFARFATPLCVAGALLGWACDEPGCDICPVNVWEATLTGANHVPPVTTSAAATGTFHLNSAGSHVAYTINVSTLPATAITSATLHQAAPGANTTTVAVGLCGTGGTVPTCNTLAGHGVLISGTAPFTPAQLNAMRVFGLYANVSTTGNPTGEIRGQLRAVVP